MKRSPRPHQPTPVPEQARQDLLAFSAGHQSTSARWDDFDRGIDQWRDGLVACVPASVESALATDYTQTVRDIAAFPSGLLVRGMGETILQAADRELSAVLSLRETWRALDTSAFGRYSADRSFAETLRLQTALDLQGLLARQGIASCG